MPTNRASHGGAVQAGGRVLVGAGALAGVQVGDHAGGVALQEVTGGLLDEGGAGGLSGVEVVGGLPQVGDVDEVDDDVDAHAAPCRFLGQAVELVVGAVDHDDPAGQAVGVAAFGLVEEGDDPGGGGVLLAPFRGVVDSGQVDRWGSACGGIQGWPRMACSMMSTCPIALCLSRAATWATSNHCWRPGRRPAASARQAW